MKRKIFASFLACIMVFTVIQASGFAVIAEESIHDHTESCKQHIWVMDYIIVESDCTQNKQGLAQFHCENCQETDIQQLPLHTYSTEGKITTAPTCTQPGVITYTCTKCNEATRTEVIPANGHDFQEVTVEPTCTENGTTTRQCKNCDEAYIIAVIPAKSHTYKETGRKEATCTEKGSITYTCECGDEYSVVLPKLEHEYEQVVTAPTCTEKGYTTYTCKLCKDSYVADYVPANGHTYQKTSEPATCEKTGLETYTCVCGATYTVVLPMAAHEYEAVVTEPTCIERGYVTHTCKNCHKASYVDSYVPAKGHNYVSSVTTEPTCTEKGIKTFICTECGNSYTVEIPALGHIYDSGVVTAPTCTENGYTTYTCTRNCGEFYTTDVIKATGHEFGSKLFYTDDNLCIYKTCDYCNEVLIVKNLGSEAIAPDTHFSRKIVADVAISAKINEQIELTVKVDASSMDLTKFDELWLELNGEKIALTQENFTNGIYENTFTFGVINVEKTFIVSLKGTIVGILCSTENTTFQFELLNGEYVVEALVSEKLEGATAKFVERGLYVGQTANIFYRIQASTVSQSDVLVLRYFGGEKDGEIYATMCIADMTYDEKTDTYVAEFAISAGNWEQFFAATICNAENVAISNTNFYSVSLYASRHIDMEDSKNRLSNVLRAMMFAIAE